MNGVGQKTGPRLQASPNRIPIGTEGNRRCAGADDVRPTTKTQIFKLNLWKSDEPRVHPALRPRPPRLLGWSTKYVHRG